MIHVWCFIVSQIVDEFSLGLFGDFYHFSNLAVGVSWWIAMNTEVQPGDQQPVWVISMLVRWGDESVFLSDLGWLWLWPFLWSGVSGQPGSEWHFKILRHFKLFDLLHSTLLHTHCSALHKKHSDKSQGETVNMGELFVGFIGAKSSINQSNKPIIWCKQTIEN